MPALFPLGGIMLNRNSRGRLCPDYAEHQADGPSTHRAQRGELHKFLLSAVREAGANARRSGRPVFRSLLLMLLHRRDVQVQDGPMDT